MDLFNTTLFLSIFSPALPLLIYGIVFRKVTSHGHLVGLLLAVCFATDIALLILSRSGQSTILLNNLYDVVVFVIITVLYVQFFSKRSIQLIFVLGSTLYASTAIYFAFTSGFNTPLTILWSINSTLTGIYGLIYFVLMPTMIVERLLDKNLYSYVISNASLTFFSLITVLFFFLANHFFTNADAETNRLFWSLHNIANIIKNFGLAIGLYYTGRRDVKTTLLEIERIGRERSGEPRDPLWTNSLKK